MRNNKILGVLLWVIALLAVHLVIFVIPDTYTMAIWITYGFTLFAFLSQLILWIWIWHKEVSASEQFLHTPTLTVSVSYLALQFALDLLFSLISSSMKVTILVNAALAVILGSMLVGSLIAKHSIQRLDRRQKNHHVEL